MTKKPTSKDFQERRTVVRDIWETHNKATASPLQKAVFLDLDLIKSIVGWAAGIAAVGTPLLALSSDITTNRFVIVSLVLLIIVVVYGIALYKFHLFSIQKKLRSQLDINNAKFTQALALAHQGIQTPSQQLQDQITQILASAVEEKSPKKLWKFWLEKTLEYLYYLLFILAVATLAWSFITTNTDSNSDSQNKAMQESIM